MAQIVKNLSAVQDTQVRSLCWEDALEKEMATHSSILAWETPWTEEPGRLQSIGSQRVRYEWATNTFIFILELIANLHIGKKELENVISKRFVIDNNIKR